MGLELGPPWLVLARECEDDGTIEILLRDNFTGAAMQRINAARRHEAGSFVAAMNRKGQLAVYPDGSIFDPVEHTKGRFSGTYSERGHKAQIEAVALFKTMRGISEEIAFRPKRTGWQSLWLYVKWILLIWGFVAVVELILRSME